MNDSLGKLLIDILPEEMITVKNRKLYSDCLVTNIGIDSRQIKKNGLFFAVSGKQFDGHDFINSAISNGAKVIICEKITEKKENILYLQVLSVKAIIGEVASLFFNNPSSKLEIIGVTGTNGKTSIATLLHQMATSLSLKSGLLSTVVNKIANKDFEATHTTGDAIQIQENLAKMVNAGCTHCFMEVSSHALDQGRTVAVDFNIAIFTNLSQDHLDYHETMEDYLQAKKIFFDQLSSDAQALVNLDDLFGLKMVEDTKAKVSTYGQTEESDYLFSIDSVSAEFLELTIQDHPVKVPLVGDFNAYNFAAIYVSLILLGFRHDEIEPKISLLEGVPGRMEKISMNGVVGIVDYAHTPDALENVLITLNKLKADGKVITVIGCGGDRDRGKRPRMSSLAEKYSDIYVLTSDNPRTEDPQTILTDMISGLTGNSDGYIIANRREAIEKAAELAQPGDILLVAGKGHENYQIIGTTKYHFDDKEELKKVLA